MSPLSGMSEIQGDMLFRKTPVYDNEGTYIAVKNELVITKEEFLACYNEWVLKPMRENPVSIQDEFCVPVDNGGVTPV